MDVFGHFTEDVKDDEDCLCPDLLLYSVIGFMNGGWSGLSNSKNEPREQWDSKLSSWWNLLPKVYMRKILHTKYFNPKFTINWGEKSIHDANKPPCDIEGDGYWKGDNTENWKKKKKKEWI